MYKLKNFRMILSFITVTVFTLIVTSCTSTYYQYTPPASHEGKMCINECLKNKSLCMVSCDKIKAQYDTMDSISKTIIGVTKKDTTSSSPSCATYDKNSCYVRCREDYRECYENCGGKVERVVEDNFKRSSSRTTSSTVPSLTTTTLSYGSLSFSASKIKLKIQLML